MASHARRQAALHAEGRVMRRLAAPGRRAASAPSYSSAARLPLSSMRLQLGRGRRQAGSSMGAARKMAGKCEDFRSSKPCLLVPHAALLSLPQTISRAQPDSIRRSTCRARRAPTSEGSWEHCSGILTSPLEVSIT